MSILEDAVTDLLGSTGLSIEAAMARHFTPAFRQRSNGAWEDYGSVQARLTRLRGNLDRMTFTVLDELSSGERYAERHAVELAMTDGSEVRLEVHVFAQREPDGRFAWIEESSFPLLAK